MRSLQNTMQLLKWALFIFIVVGSQSFATQAFSAELNSGRFDHFTTGFPLAGVHARIDCEDCHRYGIFKGTPQQCSRCHMQSGVVDASSKPANHIKTTNTCDDCHTEHDWQNVPVVDHGLVFGTCVSCHDGKTAMGKTPQHIKSDNECERCHHSRRTWTNAYYDHQGVSGNCASCHNGTTATGKHANHVQTSEDCVMCHSTRAWTPASFDHSNITAPCSSCHNGTKAAGKHANHVQTSLECDSCHSTRAWRPASFDHTNVTAACSSCHNGTTATGKNNGHFVTTRECDACHTTTNWSSTTAFRHTTSAYPGDHRGNLRCSRCHTSNNEVVPYPNATYKPDCAACHAGDYRPGAHQNASVSSLRNCAGSCHRSSQHRVSDRDWGD